MRDMQMITKTVSRQTLYHDFDSVLDQVSREQTPTLVTQDGQPNVVLLPYETYQQWVAAREQRLRQASQNLQAWVSKHAEALTELDAVQLVREVRAEQ
jgi:prevent-host-death family protein